MFIGTPSVTLEQDRQIEANLKSESMPTPLSVDSRLRAKSELCLRRHSSAARDSEDPEHSIEVVTALVGDSTATVEFVGMGQVELRVTDLSHVDPPLHLQQALRLAKLHFRYTYGSPTTVPALLALEASGGHLQDRKMGPTVAAEAAGARSFYICLTLINIHLATTVIQTLGSIMDVFCRLLLRLSTPSRAPLSSSPTSSLLRP